MSNTIIRIAAGILGLAVVALPQLAGAQTSYDGPSSYQPYSREDFRPVGEGTNAYGGFNDRRPGYDEDYRPRHRYPDGARYDENRPSPDFGGPEVYGRPDHWNRWDHPGGFPADGYRPVAVPVGPVYGGSADGRPIYGAAARRDPADLGCTVQRSERYTYDGAREILTRKTCYAR